MPTLWRSVLSALHNPQAPGALHQLALGAADLALGSDEEATADDVCRTAREEFGVELAPHAAATALATRRRTLSACGTSPLSGYRPAGPEPRP
ncbi:hypothetical protein SAMN05216223_106191 [Actinacidiphila yanglinensis]|uniref:Uncharacterized protein n=1 Tax=Actinacidiphila yanglinensis TaxID=310779 RepID=A0A1H6B375_9ACTN|nr:hypothetical protein [Actinacidiphila yanglinensis]SEG55303.1 hypothetical protein SAMN05216223_106191 [Actinacidiphila yanglinensis]